MANQVAPSSPFNVSTAPHCSICLEPVVDNNGRSIAKLHCRHFFHLDCIGSEFNAKQAMQCPNCRATEDGRWLFAGGLEQWESYEETYNDPPPLDAVQIEFQEGRYHASGYSYLPTVENGAVQNYGSGRGYASSNVYHTTPASVVTNIHLHQQNWIPQAPILTQEGNTIDVTSEASEALMTMAVMSGMIDGMPIRRVAIEPVILQPVMFDRSMGQQEGFITSSIGSSYQANNDNQTQVRNSCQQPSYNSPSPILLALDEHRRHHHSHGVVTSSMSGRPPSSYEGRNYSEDDDSLLELTLYTQSQESLLPVHQGRHMI